VCLYTYVDDYSTPCRSVCRFVLLSTHLVLPLLWDDCLFGVTLRTFAYECTDCIVRYSCSVARRLGSHCVHWDPWCPLGSLVLPGLPWAPQVLPWTPLVSPGLHLCSPGLHCVSWAPLCSLGSPGVCWRFLLVPIVFTGLPCAPWTFLCSLGFPGLPRCSPGLPWFSLGFPWCSPGLHCASWAP